MNFARISYLCSCGFNNSSDYFLNTCPVTRFVFLMEMYCVILWRSKSILVGNVWMGFILQRDRILKFAKLSPGRTHKAGVKFNIFQLPPFGLCNLLTKVINKSRITTCLQAPYVNAPTPQSLHGSYLTVMDAYYCSIFRPAAVNLTFGANELSYRAWNLRTLWVELIASVETKYYILRVKFFYLINSIFTIYSQ
jgi:hypothetical protein